MAFSPKRILSASSVLVVLVALELFQSAWVHNGGMVDACGFPMPQTISCGGCGGGGCGGGGCGGGGFGRKKRQAAVVPHFKTEDVPCPQTEWKKLIEESVADKDVPSAVNAVQTAFYRRYGAEHGAKFLVACALNKANEAEAVPSRVHFSSGGDGYCNVVRERLWCQVVSLSA